MGKRKDERIMELVAEIGSWQEQITSTRRDAMARGLLLLVTMVTARAYDKNEIDEFEVYMTTVLDESRSLV